jgi:sugar phosphate isomerase/epimerase
MDVGVTVDNSWRVDAPTLVGAARSGGFHLVGLSGRLVDESTRGVLEAAGAECHELLGVVVTDDLDTTLVHAERLTEQAALVHARWISTTFTAPLSDTTRPVLARCAAMFAEAGATMAIEFSPLGPVPSIAAGLDAVEAAGHGRAGLVIDSWNFSFGPDTFDDLAAVPLERIAYLQFNDALAPVDGPTMEEALNRRVMPGDGVLELDRFVSTLRDRGWDGVVSMQVLSEELRQLPLAEFMRRAHDAAAAYWL